MNEQRIIKKEKQRMFTILDNLYDDHKPLDYKHLAGSNSECEICQWIVKCSDVINKLEKEIDKLEPEKIKSASLAYYEPTQNRVPIKVNKFKVFHVHTGEGDEYYYRVLTKKEVLQDFDKEECGHIELTVIDESDWDSVFLESGEYGFVMLRTIVRKDKTGRIGEKSYSNITSMKECTRKKSDDFIFYDGENHDEVIAFCGSSYGKQTKKGNKINVISNRGSFSMKPETYLTKNVVGQLDSYDKDEFEALYDITDKKVWTSI